MKKVLAVVIGIGAFAAIAGSVVFAVFHATSGMVDTATAFFEAVQGEDFTAARGYLSEDFKAGTTPAALEDFLLGSALVEYRDASWSSRRISGGIGTLEGKVTTESGGVVPLSLTFVEENGTWKIYAIRKPRAGLQAGSAAGIPSSAEQTAMVERAVRDFGISVEQQSMEHFRSTLSGLWQRQDTTEELDEVFGVAYGIGLHFAFLDSVDPIVEPVTGLGENGMLVLKGYFPTRPGRFHFEQSYIFEGVGWKLSGFSFEIKEAPVPQKR